MSTCRASFSNFSGPLSVIVFAIPLRAARFETSSSLLSIPLLIALEASRAAVSSPSTTWVL